MLFIRSLLIASTVAALTVPALAQQTMQSAAPNAAAAGTMNVVINPQNSSGQSGTAVIKDVSGGIEVTVALKGEPDGASEAIHIHEGTCAKLNPAPWKALTNVINGTSKTTIQGVSVADLQKGTYAINAHDEKNLAHYVACGNLSS
jgi:Cu/Zn superoxide dismutase